MVITGQELSKYFSADKTPKEMRAEILRLLDENLAKTKPDMAKQPKEQDETQR